jgi:hypothetical protein
MAKSRMVTLEAQDGFRQPYHRLALGTLVAATAVQTINAAAFAAKEIEVQAVLLTTNGTFNVTSMLEGQTIRFKIRNTHTANRQAIFQRNGVQTGIIAAANGGKTVNVTANQTWVFTMFFDGVDYRLSRETNFV